MMKTEITVIGGGPAGMCAALAAAKQGADVILIEREKKLGGQLVKQTHRFFGSEKEYAGTRGIDIAQILREEIKHNPQISVIANSTVTGIYSDGIITVETEDRLAKVASPKTIVATGASEKLLAFPNNDLPGIYGAGAVQTLMNLHGVVPGQNVLMVGAGNIGLIVSYQLLQAGVKVAAIIDAAPRVGGYLVHAAKVKRNGVPILTSHTVVEAIGKDVVEGAIICEVDASFKPIAGTEKKLDVDTICLAVGLSPLVELLWGIGCEMKYVPQLGGYVPLRDNNLETSMPGYYVAGDASGIEEASSAMIEGSIAGLSAAGALGYNNDIHNLKAGYIEKLSILRSGHVGEKIRQGLAAVTC